MAQQPFFRWEGRDLILNLHVQPRASRDEIAGAHGDRLRVRITAPPVEGAANAHLIEFISRVFGVRRQQVILVRGETGRLKCLRICDPVSLPAEILR